MRYAVFTRRIASESIRRRLSGLSVCCPACLVWLMGFGLITWVGGSGIAAATPGAVPTAWQEQEPAEKSDPGKSEPGDKPAEQEPEAKGAQDGEADLEKALELKETAASSRDLDRVVDLCKTALEKGLSESSKKLAENLMKSTLQDQIRQLMVRIEGGDGRWRFLRREALTRLERLLEFDPQNAQAHLQVAQLQMREGGDADKGRVAIDKAIEHAGPDKATLADALLLRAVAAEDDDAKLSDLNQAILIDENNVRARIARGEFYLEKEEVDKAVEDFRVVLKGMEDINPQILLMLASQLQNQQRPQEALEFADRLIELQPENLDAFRLRGTLHAELYQHAEARADRQKAIELIDQLLEKNPENPLVLLLKSNLHLDLQDGEGALAAINKALELEPEWDRGLLFRSLAYSQLEKYDEAIADIQTVLESLPDTSFRLQLAAYQNAAKKTEDALKVYAEVIAENEKLLKQAEEGDNDVEAESLRGTLARAVRGRADAYSAIGDGAAAIADYERAIELEKETEEGLDGSTLNNLAWLLCTAVDPAVRNGKRAVELATQANELTKFSESYALSTLGAAYAEIGDFAKAREFAEKAVAMGEKEQSRSLENLQREVQSYVDQKPWRELLTKDLAGPEGSFTVDLAELGGGAGGGEKQPDEK